MEDASAIPKEAADRRTTTQEDLINRFTYHPVKLGQAEKYAAIRSKARELAELIVDTVPCSREQSTALTNLEQTVMWANAAIARRS